MITMRKKTIKKLSDEQSELLKELIESCLNLSFSEMQNLIWELTYQPEKTLQNIGFIEEQDEGEKSYNDTDVDFYASVVRSELAIQYREVHHEWDYGTACPSDEVTQKLWKALKGERYIYHTVMEKIAEFAYFEDERILKVNRCLNSKREESQFGGLREMGFSYEEAVFLKYVANQIGEVFSNKMKEVIEKYNDDNFYGSYEHVENNEKEKNDEVAETSSEQNVEDASEKERKLSPSELLSRRAEIEDFFKALDIVLSESNWKWLYNNRERVEKFFATCDDFNE